MKRQLSRGVFFLFTSYIHVMAVYLYIMPTGRGFLMSSTGHPPSYILEEITMLFLWLHSPFVALFLFPFPGNFRGIIYKGEDFVEF